MLDDSRPLFEQIAERISSGILDGTYREETAVPSTNELARFLRVNPATAGKGLGLLVERGVLAKRRGIGMFVAPGARERLREARTREFAERHVAPMVRAAIELDIPADGLREAIDAEWHAAVRAAAETAALRAPSQAVYEVGP